jgi:hypothetical protein
MKTLVILLFSALLLSASDIADFAQKMQYETVYETAKARALKENKPLMMVMVTHYCPWCRKFERRTLEKSSVNTIVQKNFVPLIVNREAKLYPKQFFTPRIPVVFFIDPKKESHFWESIGYKTISEFSSQIRSALDNRNGEY